MSEREKGSVFSFAVSPSKLEDRRDNTIQHLIIRWKSLQQDLENT